MNVDIEFIKKMINNTTEGPWVSYVEGRDMTSCSSFIMTSDSDYPIDFINIKEGDQDFIAMARNYMPVLVEEVIRLQTILKVHSIEF
jgi:hypothetical protein